MANKKGKRKKESSLNIDIMVVGLMLLSIILGVLIYTKQGYIGEILSPMLGGLVGFIKYIIPAGIFAVAISMVNENGENKKSKLIQYGLFLLCISIVLSVFQISQGRIDIAQSMDKTVQDAYYLGEKNIGGGVVGAVIAAPLVKAIGELGTVILALGTSVTLFIFMFGIKPTEYIADILDDMNERKEERREIRQERAKQVAVERPQTKKERKIIDSEIKTKERLDGQQELDVSPFKIQGMGIENEEEKSKPGLFKKFKHNSDDLMPLGMEGPNPQKLEKSEIEQEQPAQSPDYIEANLFRTEEIKREEKVKEVLNLEHALMVEDEHYEFPPIQLLSEGERKGNKNSKKVVADTAARLQKTLYSFGVSAKVENVCIGPAITRYELKPSEGVRVSKIAKLSDDIALSLAAESIRIEAPIPGKQAVGIEVPNKENEMVHLRDILDCEDFKNHKSKLAFAIGKDVAGKEIVSDIGKMPHVLIAGATGSGKSVCINTLITSIIYKAKPSEVKLVMIDPKVVELSVYNGIPHLLIPVVTDSRKAAGALAWAVQEMVNRYTLFANKNVRDMKGYNEAIDKEGGVGKLPQIVIIIDELADLMMVSPKDVEEAICRLAQMARAAGMHLVIATQRPSVDVITGIIKANIPSRISFAVSSQVDSRTILDMAGAEKLLGKGDMLFYPSGASKPTRIQGAFVSDKEVEKIVDFVKANGEANYSEDILESIENANKSDRDIAEEKEDDDTDPFLSDAIEVVIETGQASTSFIQRRFKVGYARAGRIIDQMEARGIISGYQGSKPREVLMPKERWAELKMNSQIAESKVEKTVEMGANILNKASGNMADI